MDYNIPDRERCPDPGPETFSLLLSGVAALIVAGVFYLVVIAVVLWAWKSVFGS